MSKLATTAVDAALNYAEIGRRVFDGDILIFGADSPAGGAPLLRAARKLCRETFETSAPQKAHRLFPRDEFLARAAQAQKTFNTDPYRALFADWLRALGIDAAVLLWDTLGLRIAPPTQTHSGGFRSTTPVHRDTWGTGIQTQINWWAPIYPLSPRRTMAFFPDYWQKPLANTTAEWSFEEYMKNRRRNMQNGKAADYPSVPQATEQPTSSPVPLMMQCGELAAFSAAHLHCSIANRTDMTRYSFEIRTLNPTHECAGAPNADCHSHPPLVRLFKPVAQPAN